MASARKSCPERSRSSQTATTLESGGSRCALPLRPANSQMAARVSSEIILRVPAFIFLLLFASDLFKDLVQWRGIESLVKAYGVWLEQPRFLEELDARLASLSVGAAVDVPNSELLVRAGNGIDEFRLGLRQ